MSTLSLASVLLSAGFLAGCANGQKADDKPPAPAAAPEVRDEKSPVPDGVGTQHRVLAEELEEKGQTVTSGDWTINLITEAAEPWHEVDSDGGSTFREPAGGETNHIEIIPVETETGRIVPDVPITVDVIDEKGASVQKLDLNFYWATFTHYANNFSIPERGSYTLKVTVGAPTFPRHGDQDQKPTLSKAASVEFTDVNLGTE